MANKRTPPPFKIVNPKGGEVFVCSRFSVTLAMHANIPRVNLTCRACVLGYCLCHVLGEKKGETIYVAYQSINHCFNQFAMYVKSRVT